jgi:hypothetical protein
VKFRKVMTVLQSFASLLKEKLSLPMVFGIEWPMIYVCNDILICACEPMLTGMYVYHFLASMVIVAIAATMTHQKLVVQQILNR